jgi:hypothetical protein
MLVVGYLLVSGAAYLLTWGLVKPDNPLLIAVTLFVIAAAFTPVRLRLERAVDRAFFSQRRLYEKRLEQFARSLTTSVDMNDAVKKLTQQLDETLPVRIYLSAQPIVGRIRSLHRPGDGQATNRHPFRGGKRPYQDAARRIDGSIYGTETSAACRTVQRARPAGCAQYAGHCPASERRPA